MIDKFDMLHQTKMMYSKENTTVIKLINYNECLVTSPIPYMMLTNFTQLYRRNRIFKIAGLQ